MTSAFMHGFQTNLAAIVLLEEHHTNLEGQMIKWPEIELFQAITCTLIRGFQNNLAQLFSLRRSSAI